MQAATLQRALEWGVYLFFLVAKATHFLQPLHAAPFGVFHRDLRRVNDQFVMDALSTGEGTRDALLAAAFHCERRCFTEAVVQGAFRTTGLWPFDPYVVIARARENLGVPQAGASVREEAQVMAAEVIGAARQKVTDAMKRVSGGSAVVARGALHSPYDSLAAARNRTAEAAAEADALHPRKKARLEKASEMAKEAAAAFAARQDMVCEVCRATRHRGGEGWVVCRYGHWRACRGCKSSFCGRAAIGAHGGSYSGAASGASE